MTTEEALTWCIEALAVVTFGKIQGEPHIIVKPAGFPQVARKTFVEAVEAAQMWVERAEKERLAWEQAQAQWTALHERFWGHTASAVQVLEKKEK